MNKIRLFLHLTLITITIFTTVNLSSVFAQNPINQNASEVNVQSYSRQSTKTTFLPVLMKSFDFKRELFQATPSLNIFFEAVNPSTGLVNLNGGDSRAPSIPFTFNWGDGSSTNEWFPEEHTYSDNTRNYIITVTAHYSTTETDSAQILVRFVTPQISTRSVPDWLAVTISDHEIELDSRMPGYVIPPSLTYFDDSVFTTMTRGQVEYILSLVAEMQAVFSNNNLFLPGGNFNQVMLSDPSFTGMYALWYTTPISFGAGDYAFGTGIQYSSFFHEMGHNFTLNFPANFIYGGKIDGNANAIYSETMAQIMAHTAAYYMINQGAVNGLSYDLVFEIKQSAQSSMRLVRFAYDTYINTGKVFHSWNDPLTPLDETFNTFMTLAYKFFEHAEQAGKGYQAPLSRMMKLLSVFDSNLQQSYSPNINTSEAETFRSTLMVTAISYGFSIDLRNEFRNLNFPINDSVYDQLITLAGP